MERWRGRVAVVTGAGAGIGAAVGVTLANAGLTVVGLDLRPELVDDLSKKVTGPGSLVGRKCDISNVEEVDATFRYVEDSLGGTDLLVNNAGAMFMGQITEVGDEPLTYGELMMQIDVNFKGPVICTRRAVASMTRRGFDGHIININSIAGHYVPYKPTYNVYPSTKYAITAFTESLVTEIASFGSKIKVTSISPGVVNTSLAGSVVKSIPSLEPQDIADAVSYVVSTPPHINITELSIGSILEKKL